MNRPGSPEASYELTVVGGLGPALRARFLPAATTSCAVSTTLCLRAHGDTDLVDVLRLLAAHGLEVTSIVTPRPRFSKEYEDLIEARNQTENQLKVIDSELARAKTERDRKLAEVERDQNKIIQTKRAELETTLATAVTAQVETHRVVDTYKIEKLGAGQAARSAAQGKAQELKGQLDAEFASRKAEIDAFRNQPVERVMERLGERLKDSTIEIQPFRNDGSPQRVQLENVGGR